MADETLVPENQNENTTPENDNELEESQLIKNRKSSFKQKISNFGAWYKSHKKISIPLTILVIALLLLATPFTRYAILGTFMKQTVQISVKDSQTSRPVTEAQVSLAGQTVDTDNDGIAQFTVKVGPKTATITKAYYNDADVKLTVPVMKPKGPSEVSLQANGRVVPVKVTNKITAKSANNVLVKSGEAEARTDEEGKATLVVPVDQTKALVELGGDGYAASQTEVDVEKASQSEAELQVVSSGKVYFLSKQSGKVDVVKTNLDGSDRQVVLAGTGREDSADTILLASRDWKYLALKSKRDGGENSKLFLIDTNGDKVTTMDEGNATFSLDGWTDHYFVYTVYRNGVQQWQPKRTALKSYNADSKQLATLDETEGAGDQYSYAYQTIDNVYAFPGAIVYTKVWSQRYSEDLANRKTQIISVNPNGQNKVSLKDLSTAEVGGVSFIIAKLYEPEEIYYQVHINGQNQQQYYEYEDGKVISTNSNDETFNKFYPTFLLSPSAQHNFWYEPRDGKNTLFVGDKAGENAKQIATLSEYIPYGWFTDDYVLVTKSGSELYIMPRSGIADGGQILKVSDYHKPQADFTGYGGGYGGF